MDIKAGLIIAQREKREKERKNWFKNCFNRKKKQAAFKMYVLLNMSNLKNVDLGVG